MVQSKIEKFSLKTYKISEQQINAKVLSVANSCHYNENSKNGKSRLWKDARPSEATPTKPRPPRQKLGCNMWGGHKVRKFHKYIYKLSLTLFEMKSFVVSTNKIVFQCGF